MYIDKLYDFFLLLVERNYKKKLDCLGDKSSFFLYTYFFNIYKKTRVTIQKNVLIKKHSFYILTFLVGGGSTPPPLLIGDLSP